MRNIQFPIEVSGIKLGNGKVIEDRFDEAGTLVAVRPCGKEYQGKTYLGLHIGDVALGQVAKYNRETKEIEIDFSMHNPAIYIFALKKIVYGCESWWRKISDPSELREITDEDIENTWYVQLLRQIEKEKDEAKSE